MPKSPHAGERASPLLTAPYLPKPQPPQENPVPRGRQPLLLCRLPRALPLQSTWAATAPKSYKPRQHNPPWPRPSEHCHQPASRNRSCPFSLSSPCPPPPRALFSFISKAQPSLCHRWAGEWGKGALYNRSVAICQLGQAACSRLHRIKYLITDYTPMGHD